MKHFFEIALPIELVFAGCFLIWLGFYVFTYRTVTQHEVKKITDPAVFYNCEFYSNLQTFYITKPYDFKDGMKVQGHDRMDALANAGFTIWTEFEWENGGKHALLHFLPVKAKAKEGK
jgi:hypothetical protein